MAKADSLQANRAGEAVQPDGANNAVDMVPKHVLQHYGTHRPVAT